MKFLSSQINKRWHSQVYITPFGVILAFLLILMPAWAAPPTVDGSSSSACPEVYGVGTSYTFSSHSIAGNLLLVGVGITSFSQTVSSVTLGGVALTYLDSITPGADLSTIEVWYKKAPAGGSGTIEVTLDGTPTYGSCAVAVSLNNVDQTSTFGTPVNTASGGATSTSVDVSGDANGMIVDFVQYQPGTDADAAPSPQTLIALVRFGNGAVGSSYATGAGTRTMGWSWASSSPVSQSAVLINGITATTVVRHKPILQ